jgi:hypothetical protein
MYGGLFNFTVTSSAGKIPTWGLNTTTNNATDPMVFNGTTETHKIQSDIAFNVTEVTQQGWKVTLASCTVNDMNGQEKETYDAVSADLGNETANGLVQIPAGAVDPMDAVICDYENDSKALIKIIKNTTEISPDTIDHLFNFTIIGINNDVNTTAYVNVTAGTHMNMTEVMPFQSGQYNITEADHDNWTLQSVQCKIWDVLDDEDHTKIDANATENGINPKRIQNNGTNLDLAPWELAECTFVNDNPTGYITGGGRVILNEAEWPQHNQTLAGTDKVTHGFQLHCNVLSGPNNLEVNWNGNKFHLEELESALCIDDGSVNEPPPKSNGSEKSRKPTTDIYHGFGYGRVNGECGASAEWIIDDNGEPGKADQIIALQIRLNGTLGPGTGDFVLDINPDQLMVTNSSISGTWKDPHLDPDNPLSENDDLKPWLDLESGNHQWTPHPSKKHGPTQTVPCPEVTP